MTGHEKGLSRTSYFQSLSLKVPFSVKQENKKAEYHHTDLHCNVQSEEYCRGSEHFSITEWPLGKPSVFSLWGFTEE